MLDRCHDQHYTINTCRSKKLHDAPNWDAPEAAQSSAEQAINETQTIQTVETQQMQQTLTVEQSGSAAPQQARSSRTKTTPKRYRVDLGSEEDPAAEKAQPCEQVKDTVSKKQMNLDSRVVKQKVEKSPAVQPTEQTSLEAHAINQVEPKIEYPTANII